MPTSRHSALRAHDDHAHSPRTGLICLDILSTAWASLPGQVVANRPQSPVLTLKSALLSLQSLLCSPEPKDPQDAVVAQHYLSDRKGFDETARYWTQMYASPDGVASGSKPAPPPPAGAASSSRPAPAPAAVAPTADRARLNGIDAQHADQFAAMGFDRERVIDVLCVVLSVEAADRSALR